MPIFGQVWLWSSLAFLLGALLCWGLVALPARRRVGELESELAARARRQPPERPEPRRPVQDERDDYDPRALVPGLEPDDEVHNESLTRAYALSGTRGETPPQPPAGISGALGGLSAPPETDTELSDGPRTSATQYLNVSGSGSLDAPAEVPPQDEPDRGWFGGDDDKPEEPVREDAPQVTTVLPQVPAEPVEDGRLVDDIDEADDADAGEDGGTVFTQRTHPIPGELIRQLDESAPEEREPAHRLEDAPAHELVDDLDDDLDGEPDERTILTEPAGSGESKHQLVEDPAVPSTQPPAEPAHGAHDRTEVVPAHTAEEQTAVVSASGRPGAVGDQNTSGAEEPKIMPGVTVQAESSQNKLPKRVPSKPPSRTPFGVKTTSPANPAPAAPSGAPAQAESANEASRSLFEPIVPAGDGAPKPVPPPHRVRGAAGVGEGGGPSNGRGPFGPGSAMPLPGGAPPSPEYTIKASASAMRYCTPESEKFGRTVAEVWFRTAADAERVGFRPVT
ncbi:sunset domain-containing protein [Actinophytocola gossypii]|uniref:Secreted protein n=1 Tax=Actinophytocola gossypii TaxID=2812003 RepID=A0ABT2J5E4_9PSEU|nr:hypothetical protein [Actinophytocola gossypii]MCT2583088.1 hypothetical protein [Actinophytocola gossypii]